MDGKKFQQIRSLLRCLSNTLRNWI